MCITSGSEHLRMCLITAECRKLVVRIPVTIYNVWELAFGLVQCMENLASIGRWLRVWEHLSVESDYCTMYGKISRHWIEV